MELQEVSAEFERKIFNDIRGSFTSMGLAIGCTRGLFAAMCELDSWATSAAIAEQSQCKERYVREWLYHMTSCGVVEMDDSGDRFILPKAHRSAVTGDLIKMAKMSIGMSSNFPLVVETFANDGPPGIHDRMVNSWLRYWEGDTNMKQLFQSLVSQLPLEVQQKLESGMQCCDLGGGRGKLVLSVAYMYPNVHFTSCDHNLASLEEAAVQAEQANIKNIDFQHQDIENLPDDWSDKFDYLTTIIVLHNLPNPLKAVEQMFKVLKPGGYLSVVEEICESDHRLTTRDIGNKKPACMLYAISMYYCLPSGLAESDGAGLGAIPGHQKLYSIIKDGGFGSIERFEVEGLLHLLCKKVQ